MVDPTIHGGTHHSCEREEYAFIVRIYGTHGVYNNFPCKRSSTFKIFKDDHYSKALNSHQDNGRYTRDNNHFQLCTIAILKSFKKVTIGLTC